MQHVCLSTCTIQQDIISKGSEVFVFYHKFLFDMLDLQNFKKILWNWNDQNVWIVFIDNIICYHWWTCFSTESAFLWVPHFLLFFFQNHNFVWSLPRNIGHRLSKCQELNKLYIFTYLCYWFLLFMLFSNISWPDLTKRTRSLTGSQHDSRKISELFHIIIRWVTVCTKWQFRTEYNFGGKLQTPKNRKNGKRWFHSFLVLLFSFNWLF